MNSANYVSVSKGRARQQKLGDTSSNELASSQIYFGQPCTGCDMLAAAAAFRKVNGATLSTSSRSAARDLDEHESESVRVG
jgi:hypothetical protein